MYRYDKVKYNDILLSSFCEIEEIRLPVLPSRSVSTLDIPSRDGVICNGNRYEHYTIEIDILIDCDTKDELHENLKALRDCFDVDEPKPFFINENRYILAITEGSIDKEAVAFHSYTSTITLLCCEPYFYSQQITLKSLTPSKKLLVNNKCDRAVSPIVSIAFTQPTAFVQLELDQTGEKILVGKYPSFKKQTTSKTKTVLKDDCETTSTWTQSSASISADRTVGGTLAITNNGEGVMIGSLPSGSTTWKGSCYRQNLKNSCDEFQVKCNMKFNSTGKNGDPSAFDEDKETSTETVTSGSKTTYWKVIVSALNIRTGASTSYKSKGTLEKGYKITGTVKEVKDAKGNAKLKWLKFTYNGSTVYACKESNGVTYIKKYTDDNTKTTTTTTTIKNMMVHNDSGTSVRLWDSPERGSKIVCTIPNGEIVRVQSIPSFTDTYTDSNGKIQTYIYYKLNKKYNGYNGYIRTTNLVSADNAVITYPDEAQPEKADFKMGTCELYGFDVNGSILFRLRIYDDNLYYEHTKVEAMIGSKIVMENKDAPEPKQVATSSTNDNKTTVKLEYKPSGRYGDFNEFYGQWILTRKKVGKKYEWQVEVNKIKNGTIIKTQRTKTLTSSDFPTEELSYVAMYMGTNDTLDKSSDMSVTYVQVKEINVTNDTEQNVSYFDDGDILDIDFANHRCYLNIEPCDELVDIGSRYFELQPGSSSISVYSNDDSIEAELVYQNKWLGED